MTMVKTRHTKRVKRKGREAPMIARRDSSRVADLEKQVNALTRELAGAREAERQLLHSSAQFAVLVQSIKEYAIYMMDSAGHIISWNSGAERIKGYSRDEIIGQHFSRFYIDVDRKSGLPTKALRQRSPTASSRENDGVSAKMAVNSGQVLSSTQSTAAAGR